MVKKTRKSCAQNRSRGADRQASGWATGGLGAVAILAGSQILPSLQCDGAEEGTKDIFHMVFLPSIFDLFNCDAKIQLLPSQRPSVCGWSADTNLATGLQPKLKDNE